MLVSSLCEIIELLPMLLFIFKNIQKLKESSYCILVGETYCCTAGYERYLMQSCKVVVHEFLAYRAFKIFYLLQPWTKPWVQTYHLIFTGTEQSTTELLEPRYKLRKRTMCVLLHPRFPLYFTTQFSFYSPNKKKRSPEPSSKLLHGTFLKMNWRGWRSL